MPRTVFRNRLDDAQLDGAARAALAFGFHSAVCGFDGGRSGIAKAGTPAQLREFGVFDVLRQQAVVLQFLRLCNLRGAIEFLACALAVALLHVDARALQMRCGNQARQSAHMAEMLQLHQRMQRAVHVARVERQPRAQRVPEDHVIGQTHIARHRQVDAEQVIGLVELVGLVQRAGVQHTGPRVAVALVEGGEVRGFDSDAKARRCLAHAAFEQIEHAFQRLGIHAIEGAGAEARTRHVEQLARLFRNAEDGRDVGHQIDERAVGKRQIGRRGRKRAQAYGVGFGVVLLQCEQHGAQREMFGFCALQIARRVQQRLRFDGPAREAGCPQREMSKPWMRLQQRGRQALKPAVEQAQPSLIEKRFGMCRQQRDGALVIMREHGVIDGGNRALLGLVGP